MKKILPYILATVVAAAAIGLFLSSRSREKKELDERFTLKRTDKIPYGSWAAYSSLPYLFPDASISLNRYPPGYWDSLQDYDDKQVLIILSGRFDADEDEMKELVEFIEEGNHVLVSAQYLSAAADEALGCVSSGYNMAKVSISALTPGLKLRLESPLFDGNRTYGYPGRGFASFFTRLDTATTDILGRDGEGRTNFIRLQAGKGFLYVHLEPFAFTNYFLLYRENMDYLENILSLMPRDAEKVVWDEYYLQKRRRHEQDKKNWFSVLMKMENEEGQQSFRAALILLILMLLVYVFMEMRRKQRIIPRMARPRNDSLDFASTIGRLYFEKADHRNLAKKMSAYFLDHVRSRYKLATGELDDEFAKNLSYKSGVPEDEIRTLVVFIRYVDDAPAIQERELMDFYRKLDLFYQKA